MSAAALNRLVLDLGRSIVADRLEDEADSELLRRIGCEGGEAAFEVIVRRHGGAVLAAARAVLADEADVEDVFQASFIALWRGARRIRKGTSLGCWLYSVARRTALKAHARSKRRRQIEGSGGRGEESAAPDPSWREACRVLHEEIERLPEHYREPIVLCYLEGRARDEAADDLGWKLATLRGRLERGRDLLKRRLTRRGLALSTGLLATLAGDAAAAVPPALIRSALAAIRIPPETVAPLIQSAASFALPRKITLAAVILIGAGLLTAGLAGEKREPAGANPTARLPEDKPAGKKPEEKPAAKIIVTGRVLDPAGRTVPGAKVEAFRFNVGERVRGNADAEGRFRLELADDEPEFARQAIHLTAVAPGLAPGVAEAAPAAAVAADVRLAEGVPLEGRILTLEGQPVVGAELRVASLEFFAPGDLDKHLKAMQAAGDRHPQAAEGVPYHHRYLSRYADFLPGIAAPAKTDRDGRFRIPNVGPDRLVDLTLTGPSIQHVELVARTQAGAPVRIDAEAEYRRFTVLPSPFEYQARPARLLRGAVREKGTGKPVAGVKLTAKGSTASTLTDAAGRYELAGTPKGPEYELTATPPPAADLFVAERRIADTAGLDPLTVDFDLLPGIRVSGRLLDSKTQKPVAGFVEYFPLPGNAYLNPERDATGTLHRASRQTPQLAKNGDYSIVVAPGPGMLMVRADAERFVDACVDPAEFFPGQKFNRGDWGDKRNVFTPLEDGRLILTQNDYRAIVPVNPAAGSKPFSLEVPLTPATSIRARFMDPDGIPLAGVWTRGLLSAGGGDRNLQARVKDAEFSITAVSPKRPLTFYAVYIERGLCGEFTVNGDETKIIPLRLQPGATLTGRLVDGAGMPIAGAKVWASWSKPGANQYSAQNPPEVPVTDADGKFRVPWLLAGRDLMLGVSLPRQNSINNVGEVIAPLKTGESRDVGSLMLRKN